MNFTPDPLAIVESPGGLHKICISWFGCLASLLSKQWLDIGQPVNSHTPSLEGLWHIRALHCSVDREDECVVTEAEQTFNVRSPEFVDRD